MAAAPWTLLISAAPRSAKHGVDVSPPPSPHPTKATGTKSRASVDTVEESDFAAKGESLGERAFMTNGAGTSTTGPPMANHANGGLKFILDSGATHHLSSNREHFSDLTIDQTGRVVRVADGHPLPVVAIGPVIHADITLNNVLYVPDLTTNIVSVSKLAELDYSVDFTKTGCFIRDSSTGDLIGQGRLVAGLFELDYLRVPLDRAPVSQGSS